MNKVKVINLLGLAFRAGKLISGDFVVERTVKRQKTPLLLLASDCADNNKKKYHQLIDTYKITSREVLTKEEMGNAIGKDIRVVLVVVDEGFAKALLKEIDN